MASLEYKSATPFMPQGSEYVTKLTVVLPENTTIDDVLPYIGSGKGKRLTNDTMQPDQNRLALFGEIREKLERLTDLVDREEGREKEVAEEETHS